jgi:hypothetical protein
MSRYAVDYVAEAENELARLWVDSSDPQAVADASNLIDDLLAQDPHNHGRHLSEGLYRIEIQPLVVTYSIDEALHRVEVNWVRLM